MFCHFHFISTRGIVILTNRMLLFFLLLFPMSILSLNDDGIKFSLKYFKYRDVKFVCLLTCDKDGVWSHKFTKTASRESIATSKLRADAILLNGVDITNNFLNRRYSSVGVIVDSQCKGFREIVQLAANNLKFDSMHKWLILMTEDEDVQLTNATNDTIVEFIEGDVNSTINNLNDVVHVLENVNSNIDSDIIIGERTGEGDYNLYEVFNFNKERGGEIIVDNIGQWDVENGLVLTRDLNTYKYYRRWDFRKVPIRMVAVVLNPSKDFDPETIGQIPLVPGLSAITQTSTMVLKEIADMHNFRYNYTLTDRWISDFSVRSAKVASSSLYFRTQDITPVIRFMPTVYEKIDVVFPPLTSIETRYYYRIPTYGPGKFENQFFRPLSPGAWLCVLSVIIICALVLLVSAAAERRTTPVQYAVFSVIASFCQQFFEDCGDSSTLRKSLARKIAIFVTGLSTLLIYNYYTSSVVSWLLNGPPPSINSLQELLESPLQLIYEDIGYTRSWLQTPSYYYNRRNAKVEDEIRRKKIFNKKPDDPLLLPVDDGIEMVKAGGFAYHTEVNTANLLISRKFTQTELCELGSLQSMEKTMLYTGVQKNSPYKEFFIWGLSRLAERGIVSCIQHRTSSDSVTCEGSSPRALTLGGAAPAFLLLAFGYFLAVVILILERFYYNHFERVIVKKTILP